MIKKLAALVERSEIEYKRSKEKLQYFPKVTIRGLAMAGESPLNKQSDKLKNAITYVSEYMQANPGADRAKVVSNAVIRFDLSPADSEFCLKHFSGQNNR